VADPKQNLAAPQATKNDSPRAAQNVAVFRFWHTPIPAAATPTPSCN